VVAVASLLGSGAQRMEFRSITSCRNSADRWTNKK